MLGLLVGLPEKLPNTINELDSRVFLHHELCLACHSRRGTLPLSITVDEYEQIGLDHVENAVRFNQDVTRWVEQIVAAHEERFRCARLHEPLGIPICNEARARAE